MDVSSNQDHLLSGNLFYRTIFGMRKNYTQFNRNTFISLTKVIDISAFLLQFCGYAYATNHSMILKCEGRQTYQFLPALALNAPDQEEITDIGPLYYQLEFRDSSGVRVLMHTSGQIFFDWQQCKLKTKLVICEKRTSEDSNTRLNVSRETGAAQYSHVTMNRVYKSFTTSKMQCEVVKNKKLF